MLKEKEAIHCPTEDLAKQVLNILHNAGYKWCDGDSLEPRFNTVYPGSCYCKDSEGIHYGAEPYFLDKGHTIIPAEKFIADNAPFPKKFAIKVTKENLELVGKWFNTNAGTKYKNYAGSFWIGAWFHYPECAKDRHINCILQDGYSEINTEQFKNFTAKKAISDLQDLLSKEIDALKSRPTAQSAGCSTTEWQLPEKWAVKATADTVKEIGAYFNRGGNRARTISCYGESDQTGYYFHSHNLSGGQSIMADTHPGSNFMEPEIIEGFTEITFEQFKKHVLKQNMKTYKVTRANMQEIHEIACAEWKVKIAEMVKDYFGAFALEAQLDHEDVVSMFKAALPHQIPALQKIFPEYGKITFEERIKNLKPGDKVLLKITGQICGASNAHRNSFDFTSPFSVVFFKTRNGIGDSGYFEEAAGHTSYCTFAQSGKTLLFAADYNVDYITAVL